MLAAKKNKRKTLESPAAEEPNIEIAMETWNWMEKQLTPY